MNSLILIAATVALALLVGALFVPLLRGDYRGSHFFTMGGGRGKDLKLQRKVIIENLRDIAIERDGAKLDAQEFEQLAGPLSRELDRVERGLSEVAGIGSAKVTERQHFCPDCGARGTIYQPPTGAPYCEQCGSEFSI